MDSDEENPHYYSNRYLKRATSFNTATSSVAEEFIELIEEEVHWLVKLYRFFLYLKCC